MEFTFEDIIKILMKRFLLIGVCTLLGFISSYTVSKVLIRPQYSAYVQLYVHTNGDVSSNELNDLNYAQKIVTTYISFLQTKAFYQQVVEKSSLGFTSGEVRSMTSIKTVNNTEIFQITVTSYDPKVSFQLAQLMQEIGPQLIKEIKSNAQISVVDPVVKPTAPSSPNILKNTMIGGVVGFLIAAIISLLIEVLDINVKNREDLEKKYLLPILSELPRIQYDKKWMLRMRGKISYKNRHRLYHLIERHKEDTKFAMTEAYNSLKTNLRFTLGTKECKKVLFCSSVPQEGKSTTCINFALTLAQNGIRVLLMDCDLRKGRIHNSFMMKSKPGLSDVLSGMVKIDDSIRTTTHPNLHIITRGVVPPNPTELLASIQMEELLVTLGKEYEYIIIDTPPINIVSDSLSLSKMTDGVVMIVRQGITSHPNIEKALTQYNFIESKMLGFVLNGVSIHQSRDSRAHYYKKQQDDYD